MTSKREEKIPIMNLEQVYKREVAEMNESLYTAYRKIVDLQTENKQLLHEIEVLKERAYTTESWEI